MPRDRICPLYDFVIFSSNGNVTGLRPKYGSLDFDVHQYIHEGIALARSQDVPPPMLAPAGASVGPGTYKYYKTMERDLKWRAFSWQQIDRGVRHAAALACTHCRVGGAVQMHFASNPIIASAVP